MRGPWHFETPACAEIGGDFWFPEPRADDKEHQLAKTICSLCTHKTECLEWALENEHYGVWGGLGEKARKQIRARRAKSVKSN